MSTTARKTYPTRKQILAGVKEHGSISAYARALEINEKTLRSYLVNNEPGILDEIKAALKQPAKAAKPPTLGEPVSKEEIYKQENEELKRDLKNARSEDVREERVISAIERGLATITKPRYRPAPRKTSGKQGEHEFLFMWSDAHAAEIVSSEETNGANAYNWDIMLKRFEQLRDGILSYQEHRPYPVRRLRIANLGDQLSGSIHDELRETNEMPLEEAAVQFGIDGAEFVAELAEQFEEVTVDSVVGNHPRPTRKMHAKNRYANADWTAMRVLKERLRSHKNITVTVPKAQKHPIMVCGRRFLMMHGDGIRSTMVDLPVGGVVRYAQKLQNQYASIGLPLDHVLTGHWHQANVFKDGFIIVNSSIKGTDEFTMERYAGGGSPKQLLLTVHPKNGLTDISFIDCDAV